MVEVGLPEGRRLSIPVQKTAIAATISGSIDGAMTPPPPEAIEVLRSTSDYRFFFLPPELKKSTAFGRETKLADCELMADIIDEDCRSHGIAARSMSGMLISVPFSIVHSWVELEIGQEWLPYDPFLLANIEEITDSGELWPRFHSLGPAVIPLGSRHQILNDEARTHFTVTLNTRLSEDSALGAN